MNYSDNEKKLHIRELQSYLRTISFYNPAIPRLIPDGFYNEETRAAVRLFQNEYGLPVTGETDSVTWDEIYKIYLKAEEYLGAAVGIMPFSGGILKTGESGAAVYMLQIMLWEIAQLFHGFPSPKITGIYDEPTVKAVQKIQSAYGEKPTGETDIFLWNKITEMFNQFAVDQFAMRNA